MMLQNLSLMKVLGGFGIGLLLFIWLTPMVVGLIHAGQEGDWRMALKETGGRIFAVDATLREETDFLLNAEDASKYEKTFHLAYAISYLFVIALVAFALFKLFNWSIGIKQFSPSSDILIIITIVTIFSLLQFAYSYFLLGEAIVPFKDGLWYFATNLPGIFQSLVA